MKSSSFLVSSSPITSDTRLPTCLLTPITPQSHLDYSILKSSPEYAPDALAVENVRLWIELQKAQTREHKLTSQLDRSHSQMTLQGIYCDAMAKRLNDWEKKAQKHHSNRDRVSMGGQRLMTSDEWVQVCIADEEEAAAEEAAAEAERLRKATLGTKKSWHKAEAAEQSRLNAEELEEWRAGGGLGPKLKKRSRAVTPDAYKCKKRRLNVNQVDDDVAGGGAEVGGGGMDREDEEGEDE
ncbi:hypothetical protein FRB94_012673 [Tulasnella sp. JGI-2019a]|nr:hypothetical protein FRB94_012673 [Tulasnella sp. JGI-2019a]